MDSYLKKVHDTHVPMFWEMQYKCYVFVSVIQVVCIINEKIMHHATI